MYIIRYYWMRTLRSCHKSLNRFMALFAFKKSRLFNKCIGSNNDIDKLPITEIWNLMKMKVPRDGVIPAGITYLGQMISHEIVPSTNIKITRKVRPYMNLKSIYGGRRYRKNSSIFDENGKFILGSSKESQSNGSDPHLFYGEDLLRNNKGAMIPDLRNDENIIISQLHLFWQRFHNKVVDKCFMEKSLTKSGKIHGARKIVAAAFQVVTIDDFLYHILHPEIFKLYCVERRQYLYSKYSFFTSLPVEFSHAVFRFGHSMVRRKYKLKIDGNNSVKLGDLLNKNPTIPLDRTHVIDWGLFFGERSPNHTAQDASKIDTYMAGDMGNIPLPNNNPKNIVQLNLSAGLNKKVATGHDVFTWIEKHRKSLFVDAKLDEDNYEVPTYDRSSISSIKDMLPPVEKLPLWLYILHEAEFGPNKESGNHLGKIGSIIVAEVVMKSIRMASPSILGAQFDIRNLLRSIHADTLKEFCQKTQRLRMIDLINFLNNTAITQEIR